MLASQSSRTWSTSSIQHGIEGVKAIREGFRQAVKVQVARLCRLLWTVEGSAGILMLGIKGGQL